MAGRRRAGPPRPIAPGDVVAAFSIALDEWTAAQIIHLEATDETASVLELDWSGPEPMSVADLGDVSPLRLSHHSWDGDLSHCNYEWVLPRSCKVIGTLPPLHDEPSNSHAYGWQLGEQLARQRRWDGGDRGDPPDPRRMKCTGDEIDRLLGKDAVPRPEVLILRIDGVRSLDGARLVQQFPHLRELVLSGDLGLLSTAASLNGLRELQRLHIVGLFGMRKHDRLLPERVPALEALTLDGVPAEYAASMRSTWRPEIPSGLYLDIRGARKPEWVAENRNNPLRDWDGREHISGARYRKAVAQYKATRQAVMAVFAEAPADDRPAQLLAIGHEYGAAFNTMDGRAPFIETEEREDLFAALDHIVHEVETSQDLDLTWARETFTAAVDAVRDW